MTKKKRVILISTVIVLLMAAIAMLMVYLQQKKAERIQELYCKQNHVFRLGCDDWYMDYGGQKMTYKYLRFGGQK